jgi:CheY-like chemotaxis protein
VVDDIADNRDLLQTLLESEGYAVETAPEGYTAIAKIERQPPDLILLDLMMPDLDGSGVADWLTQNYPSIPILVVTGSSEFPDFCSQSKLVADCIRKPIAFEELLEKVRVFIAASRSHRQFSYRLPSEHF